jgi:multicomponent Na+:H+ antiporter subunit D
MTILILLATLGVLSGFLTGTSRMAMTIFFAIATFIQSAFLTFEIGFKGEVINDILTLKLGFFDLNFGLDLYGIIFINLVSLLWGVATLYSNTYLKVNYPEKSDRVFQFFYSLAVLHTILFALARDILTMFLLYELLTLSTIALVGFKKTEETSRGLFWYLFMLIGCSLLFLLPATIFTITQTDVVLFEGVGFVQDFRISDSTLKILFLFFILGVGKAAFFPFHIWLPSAMVAPTPVSGLLHAVAVVKVGAFFLFRLVNDVFGIELLSRLFADFNFLMYIASFTIIFASLKAVFQSNLKKRLAYSTISQISYIALALSTFSPLGLFAAMFQIITHAISKILLFFVAGAFYTSSHSNQVVDITGMGRKHKVAGLAFVFASLSLCGIPLTMGFWNKGIMFYNLINAEYHFAVVIMIISAFLSFMYLSPICYVIFKNVPQKQLQKYGKIPLTFDFVFVFLVLINLLVFVLFGLFFINYVNGW